MNRIKRPGIMAAWLIALVVTLGLGIGAGLFEGADRALASPLMLRAGEGQDAAIAFWYWISWSGGGTQRYIIVGVLALLLGFWHHWRSGLVLAGMALLSNLASDFLKDVFARARPDLVPHLDPVHSLSYPSGHATSAALVYLLFALLVPTQRSSAWIMGAALLAFLGGMSRVMLGVHWPTDLIGGWMLGGGFAFLGVSLLRRLGTAG